MCLIASKPATSALKSLKLNGTIKVYKVFGLAAEGYYYNDSSYRFRNFKLRGKYQTGYIYNPGVHLANVSESADNIHAGLHFCLTEQEANDLCGSQNIVGDFDVPIEDVAAIGTFSDWLPGSQVHKNKQVVLRKFTLTPEKHKELLDKLITQHKTTYPTIHHETI